MARAKQQQSETDEAAVAKRPARLADLHDGRRVTPMLRQFLTMKEQVPDALLLFRMGDFYEMFFEDAEVAARVLDLTLTARDKSGANPIPMAGVPHHAVRGYIRRLIEAGYRVAVADQVEDPKLARGIVKRAVTEIVTPGLLLDPESLDAQASNYLVAFLVGRSGRVGLARIDISTGEFACTQWAAQVYLLLDGVRNLGQLAALPAASGG